MKGIWYILKVMHKFLQDNTSGKLIFTYINLRNSQDITVMYAKYHAQFIE